MSKVITFSRVFPKYHPKSGSPTNFVEQFYNSLFSKNNLMDYPKGLDIDESILGVKNHTIRSGNRWKIGDKFSPRVWSEKPYNSKQIILCEDVEIKQIYQIRIWRESSLNWRIYIDGKIISAPKITELAKNDGLSHKDLLEWFNVPVEKNFEGQIIHWTDKKYL
jgi:hypothetical protein